MTRQAEAAESTAELFLDERIAADERVIDEVIAAAGSERAAVRALLTQLGEVGYAGAAAEALGSLGYRRGLQPARPATRASEPATCRPCRCSHQTSQSA